MHACENLGCIPHQIFRVKSIGGSIDLNKLTSVSKDPKFDFDIFNFKYS